MNWLLRNDRTIQRTLSILTVSLVLAAGFGAPSAPALAAFVLLLLFLLPISRLMSRAVSRGMTEFYRDCDPRPMLSNCDQLLSGASDCCSSRYILSLRADRTAALLSLGRLNDARVELARLGSALPPRQSSPTSVAYRECEILLALEEGRLQNLEAEMEAVRRMLRSTRLPSPFPGLTLPEVAEHHLEFFSCVLLLRTAGPVPSLSERILRLIEAAPCTLYQVRGANLMAEYHLSRGETPAALPYLELVARLAPQLAVGIRARDRLSRQPAP